MKSIQKMISVILAIVMTASLAVGAFAANCFPRCGDTASLVDGLKQVGANSSFDYRERIWETNGTGGTYEGSAEQNQLLLSKLKAGTLEIPGSSGSAEEPAHADSADAAPMRAAHGDMMDVVSRRAPLRANPRGSAEAYLTLRAGDHVRVTGKTVSGAGNVWYKVDYAGVEMYCYSEHLRAHTHDFRRAADGIDVCSCGELRVSSCVQNTSAAVDAVGSVLSSDVQALGAAIAGLGAAIEALFPAAIVVVAAVAGTYLLFKVGEHLTTIESVQVLSVASAKELYEDLDDGLYYAAFARRKNCLLVYNPNGMDLETANEYLLAACAAAEGIDPGNSLLNAVLRNERLEILNGIYTNNKENARRLAGRFSENGAGFSYGSSFSDYPGSAYYHENYNYPGNGLSEVNTDNCFEHYHLFTTFSRGSVQSTLHKAPNIHIFWGLPVCSAEYFSAVA